MDSSVLASGWIVSPGYAPASPPAPLTPVPGSGPGSVAGTYGPSTEGLGSQPSPVGSKAALAQPVLRTCSPHPPMLPWRRGACMLIKEPALLVGLIFLADAGEAARHENRGGWGMD